MKKIAVLLLIFIIIFSVCSCSLKDGTSDDSKDSAEEVNNKDGKDAKDNKSDKDSKTTYNLNNEVIVDNEYCTFTITKIDEDNLFGFALKTLCENKTEDKTLMFSIDNVSVNGYMVDPFWSNSVAAGKKGNSDVTFSNSSLKENGITSVDEIEFNLRVYDYDDWIADSFVDENYVIYPSGLNKSDVKIPARPTDANEYIVCDNDDCTFIIIKNYNDSIWGYTLSCYIENKTDKKLMLSWDDVSVNGYMIDPLWSSSVTPGNRKISSISFSSSDFEENNITEVSEIEFELSVYDYDNWFDDKIVESVFTYNP